jgi:ATP/maltotriose-dependent transcriptional regulator MalT
LDGMGLNGREQEILNLLLQGKKNQDIAEKMFISGHTIKNTIITIYAKLAVANRKELFHRFLFGNPKSGQ